MTGQEYLHIQITIVKLAHEIEKLNLEEFAQMIERAETAGPILDPTLFIKAQNNLAAVKKLARIFLSAKDASIELRETVFTTAAKNL